MSAPKNILIYGGTGALGKSLVSHFHSLAGWNVISVSRSTINPDAHTNIQLQTSSASWTSIRDFILDSLENAGTASLDALVCVAGGWSGGNASDGLVDTVELCINQSLQPSAVATSVAAARLVPGGLLVLTGAHAAISSTPTMIAYGLTKAAIHHLIGSLASPNAGLPENAKAVAVLPATLDTPANRLAMPHADFSTWTHPDHISSQVGAWAENTDVITSGSLFKVVTQNSQSSFVRSFVAYSSFE